MSTTTDLAGRAAQPIAARPRPRLAELDRAKGLAILLVVFGHLVARSLPDGVTWYEKLRIAVYLFHMPLFMYLSGYVTFLSGAARLKPQGWPRLVRLRAARLLLPLLVVGLLILAMKLLAARVTPVDNLPPSLGAGLRALVWDTQHSPATSIWYIGVLFLYCIITPPLLALDPRGRLLVAVAALAFVTPFGPPLYLDRAGTYFVFFVAGGIAAEAGGRWLRLVDRLWLPALAALALVAWVVASGRIAFAWTEGAQGFPYKWALLVAGLLSLPGVHGLMRHEPLRRSTSLALLGRYVFVIYLLNTLCIGAAKAVLERFVPWDARHFTLFMVVLMLAGLFGPLLAKRWLLRRVPALDRATD